MPARPKRTIRQVDLGAASAEHQHTESDITDLDHYDSSDFAADHASADHSHDHDADYAAIAHTHELDDLKATGATDGHVLTAQGDGTAAWEAPTGGGVTDHGALTGLEDDDHPQYLTVTRHDADDHSSLTITESQISDLDHYDSTDFDADFATKDTDDLAEGSTNLYLTDERVQDIIGAMLSGNTETRITVTYQDSDGTIDFEVDGDLSNYTNTLGWISDITGENLEDLANVTITSIASGEVLVWDGTGWVNRTLAEAGISAVGHTHTESDITDLDHWDQADTEGVIDAYVDKAFVDALNVDADTLDGKHASAFADAAHSHELDELDATAATDGYVLTAQGDGTAAWEPPPAVGGVTDHGDLTGLADDDHTQYLNNARHAAIHQMCKVSRATDQSIPDSTVTRVGFDNTIYDPGGWHSTVTNPSRITVPADGVYHVHALISYASNTTGLRQIRIATNGNIDSGNEQLDCIFINPAINGIHSMQADAILRLSAGDYIEVGAYQNSGGSLNVLGRIEGPYRTHVAVVRIA